MPPITSDRIVSRGTQCCPARPARNRRAGISQRALLIIAGCLVAFAAWRLISEWNHNPIPTDAAHWVYFKCKACGHEFHLNAREVDQQLAKKTYGWDEDGKTMLMPCAKCNQPKAGVTTRPAK